MTTNIVIALKQNLPKSSACEKQIYLFPGWEVKTTHASGISEHPTTKTAYYYPR